MPRDHFQQSTRGRRTTAAHWDRYFHEDWLGSTRYLTDGAGAGATSAYRTDAYGVPTAQAGPVETGLRFGGGAGYQSDGPAGLQLLGARYYDPAVGRFISPDPLGLAGGLNLYDYCEGDPVNALDPTGLDPMDGEEAMPGVAFSEFGSFYHTGGLGAFNAQRMGVANGIHQRLGLGRFKSGNRPLGTYLLHVWEYLGMAGAGGPSLHVVGTFHGGSNLSCGGGGPGFWEKFQGWVIRLARRGSPAKHSNLYEGPSHVYAIYSVEGLEKIGTSNEVTAEGESIRAITQARALEKSKGLKFWTKVLRGYGDAKSAHDYETELIIRYTRRYNRRPPGNPTNK